MKPDPHPEIIRRLHCAAGHLNAVIEMAETGQPCERCVNLTSNDAKFTQRWTRPEIPAGTSYLNQPGEGTRVQVVSANQ